MFSFNSVLMLPDIQISYEQQQHVFLSLQLIFDQSSAHIHSH